MIHAILFSGKGDSTDYITPMVFTNREHFDNFVKHEFNPGTAKHWSRIQITPIGVPIDLTVIANGEEG